MYLWNHQFSKIPPKNLIDFCPGRFYRLGTWDLFWLFSRRLYSGECMSYLAWINFQGRNSSNFLVVFWTIDDFINTFWLHLTFMRLQSQLDLRNSKRLFSSLSRQEFIFWTKLTCCITTNLNEAHLKITPL